MKNANVSCPFLQALLAGSGLFQEADDFTFMIEGAPKTNKKEVSPSKKENEQKGVSRREFLKKAAKGAGVLFAAGVLGSLPKEVFGEASKTSERVREEIQKARDILRSGNPEQILTNRYAVSALYYSDRD